MKRIVIIAGDKSGDLYGGSLCKKLNEKFSDIEILSFGGPYLARHSHQKINLIEHSVSGIFEVFSHLGKIISVFRKTLEEINKIKPDLIILIDFPDFNLRLAKTLNRRFPIFYYVSPQIWAWRKGRISQIKKYIEKMVVIFKFEVDFYKREGVDVLYFGHPLLEIIEQKDIATKKIISFLPGSRKNEIARHLPVMQAVKKNMEKELKGYQFRIIRPHNLKEAFYKSFSPDMEILERSYTVLQESEFIITSSGTATVEIAVLEVPFVVMYKVNPFTWHILKRMVNTDFISMVNILAAKKVVEEFLQNEANPDVIARRTLTCLKDRDKYHKIKEELKKIKEILSPYGATDKFADFIGGYLHCTD